MDDREVLSSFAVCVSTRFSFLAIRKECERLVGVTPTMAGFEAKRKCVPRDCTTPFREGALARRNHTSDKYNVDDRTKQITR